jgi:hypothetical protein
MTPLLWVIAFALLIVRTADAHVHVCFDGQEPRSSFHVSDPAPLCHKNDGTHQDQDFDALGDVLAKKSAGTDTLGPLPIADLVLFLLPLQRGSTDHELTTQNPSPKLPELFLPLLRGPPV